MLTVREQEYIEAAKAIGAKDHTIILKHLFARSAAIIVSPFG